MGEKCIYNYNIEFIFLFSYFYLMLHRKIEQNKLQKTNISISIIDT